MYLKSIEVHGFKSFANKLLFEFHDGITAIVGPNGSGKSNVADAVRWVLGEQSAKQLRGAKMEDVIFAGTESRRPLGFAYVALTINNEDHKLDVPYEEVTIARRVYRSGESEYLLNGTSCRLRDVQELLFDTGIGKEGYSIIGQGQIDKILSGKPEERRELFDEAAGIVKFKKRKAQAEKNLAEEQQNLVRIEDILAELEKQVEPLGKQAEKAKEYLKYRDELRSLDVNLFLSEYNQLHAQAEDLEKKEKIAADDLTATKNAFEETKAEYETIEKEIEEKNQSLEEKRQSISDSRIKLKQCDGDIKVLEEQIIAAEQTKSHYKERVDSIRESLEASQAEITKYENQKVQGDKEMAALEEKQAKEEEALRGMMKEIAEYEHQINLCNTQIKDFLQASSQVGAEQERFQTLLEQNNLKKAGLAQRILKSKSALAGFEEKMEQEKACLIEIADKLQSMTHISEELQNTEGKLQEDIEQLRDKQQQNTSNFHMENSRLKSLQNMAERYEGYGQSIKRVMEKKAERKGILGVVADIITVKRDYETAVETALGGSIQNIVTEDEQTAKDMIAYLKQNRFGRATFLPLTNIKPGNSSFDERVFKEPGVIGRASEAVEADAKYDKLVEYLLGRFLLVENIDDAAALARKYNYSLRIVTKDGELLNPGGSMSGGAYKNKAGLLGRRREMEAITEKIEEIKKAQSKIDREIEEKQSEIEKIRQKLSSNEKIIKDLGLEQNTAKVNYDRAVSDKETGELALQEILSEGMEIDRQKEELQKSMEDISKRMEENHAKSKENEETITKYNTLLEEKRAEEKEASDRLAEMKMELTALEQTNQFAGENIRRVREDIEHDEKELAEVESGRESADSLVKQRQDSILQVKEEMKHLDELIQRLEQEIVEVTKQREDLTDKHKGFFAKHEELTGRIANLDKEVFRLASQKEKITEQIDASMNYMWEQYELTYHTALECQVETEYSVPQIRKRIGELKASIRSLGDVNVNAIEDYKNLMERYELLHTQHDDLIKAEEVLEGIINELDEEMRKQFEEKFGEIRNRFDMVFKELFGGGKGTLELTEDEDILEAGIRIIAQPPGKKLQNMMQLSGGEKALSAIALLFAIQSLKPSPFCLLDEIEAALDDSNVKRYAKYLHKLTKDTQFIVITHRRGTMAAADILYGITMQEKGVSTLVSVSLLDDKDIM